MLRKGGHLEKETGFMMIDNVADGKCKVCATAHFDHQPHNQQSLHYQYRFYDEHGRFPTWKDAMAHCPDDVKESWIKALKSKGVDVNDI